MSLSTCPKCNGHVDPVTRADKTLFYFCRQCKLPFNENGRTVIDTRNLSSSFDPTRTARSITGKGMPSDMSPVARLALEALLIQGFLDIYAAGLKDGILLSLGQDVQPTKPVVS